LQDQFEKNKKAQTKKQLDFSKELTLAMKKTNAIQNEVKLLNSDVASANRIQIGNAISKAFEKHNKILN